MKRSTKKTKPLSSAVTTVFSDENLLHEVLKHVDAKTLGACACVSKHWNLTAEDERLWEMICTRRWVNIGCGHDQLRIVVLAFGGFRYLYSRYLLPLSKPKGSIAAAASSYTVAAATSWSTWPCLPAPTRVVAPVKAVKPRWGEDEIQLSLSLLAVRHFGKLNYSNRSK